MKIADVLKGDKKISDLNDPRAAQLIRQLMEYRAAAKDDELKKRLLRELVFKYAAAEKELAELHRKLVDKQRLLDEDLEAAALIQKSLLPSEMTSVDGLEIAWSFEPCEHLGGDIFNIIPLGDDQLAIYMLDVSGHGVTAAMVAVFVSQALQPHTGFLRKTASEFHSHMRIMTPAEVLTALDLEYPYDRFKNFFTITYMILNTKNGTLNYSNAGHPPAILMRRDGEFDLLARKGPAIGVQSYVLPDDQRRDFLEEQNQMQTGDKLFLHTDGIIEHDNEAGELYGSKRFYEKLREARNNNVQEIVGQAVKSSKDFGNGKPFEDDISLLGLELKN